MFKFYVFIAALVFSSFAISSDTATGKITRIGGVVSGSPAIYFGLDQEPNNRPGCSSHNIYYYVLDPNTEEGKSLYSLLLYAKSAGHKIAVNGTGSCILNQPMESVSFWILRDDL